MSESYVLATGEKGKERLEFQNKLGMEYSNAHLKKSGISQGMTVLDMGCGVGAMTTHLAKIVGPEGKVYAVDISKEQLLIAEANVKAQGLNNVIFIQGDIYSKHDIPKLDIIYMRFVLMHLTEPERAIETIKSFLKPGGVVLSQESIAGTFSVIKGYADKMLALGRHRGVDYNMGLRLEDLYKKAGFWPVEAEYKQLGIPGKDMKKFFLLGLEELKHKAIEAGVTTQEEVQLWQEEINLIEDEGNYLLAKQAYVVAWNNLIQGEENV